MEGHCTAHTVLVQTMIKLTYLLFSSNSEDLDKLIQVS